MKKLALLLALLPALALAQESGLPARGGKVTITASSPLTATVSAGGAVDMACTMAGSGTSGCVSAAAQTISGAKTFDSAISYSLATDSVSVGNASNVSTATALSNVPQGSALSYSTSTHAFSAVTTIIGSPGFAAQCPTDTPAANICENDVATTPTFVGAWFLQSGFTAAKLNVACSSGTAGTGGTTGVVVRMVDYTGNSTVGTCTLGACTTAAGVPLTCVLGSGVVLTSAHVYALSLSTTTDCATNPGRITCNVSVAPY